MCSLATPSPPETPRRDRGRFNSSDGLVGSVLDDAESGANPALSFVNGPVSPRYAFIAIITFGVLSDPRRTPEGNTMGWVIVPSSSADLPTPR